MLFHSANHSDWMMFIPPWCEFDAGESEQHLDFNQPKYFERLSYGRVILLFKARVAPCIKYNAGRSEEKSLAFIEELWNYSPESSGVDLVRSEFGCPRLYRTRPAPTYYVIDVWRIISDAPIIPDPINRTIPFQALKYRGAVRHNPNPSAKADSAAGKHDGSPLFIVNRWAFTSARASSGVLHGPCRAMLVCLCLIVQCSLAQEHVTGVHLCERR